MIELFSILVFFVTPTHKELKIVRCGTRHVWTLTIRSLKPQYATQLNLFAATVGGSQLHAE